MPLNFRSFLIRITTFLGGLYFFLEYVFPKESGIGTYHDQITTGVQVVGSMAVGLGIINIIKVHGGRIIRTRTGWQNSIALMLGLAAMLSIEAIDLVQSQSSARKRQELDTLVMFVKRVHADAVEKQIPPEPRIAALERRMVEIITAAKAREAKAPAEEKEGLATFEKSMADAAAQAALLRERYAQVGAADDPAITAHRDALSSALVSAAAAAQAIAAERTKSSLVTQYRTIAYQGFVEALGSAMFALLAFYIANAAYRAFRVRSVEAMTMMIAALIVMLGQIPFGPLYISEHIPAIRLWLIENISTPAFRAIYFGAAIAGLSMAVRMWLSLERSPLVADDQPSPSPAGGAK